MTDAGGRRSAGAARRPFHARSAMTMGWPGGARFRRIVRVALGGAFVAVAAWGAGVVWFSQQIPRAPGDRHAVTDAVVVLTGGSRRVRAGFALLDEGLARSMFVSGVQPGVGISDLLRSAQRAPGDVDKLVELGHDATDTAGNARETARWMAARNFRSLRLVTASYHMPRSLAEFRRAMAGVTVIPHPVFPDRVRIDAWWRSPGTASLIASEFTKYLLDAVRAAGPSSE